MVWHKLVQIQFLAVSISGMRNQLERWKQRLGNRGQYPEIWGDIDKAISAVRALELNITAIQKEKRDEKVRSE